MRIRTKTRVMCIVLLYSCILLLKTPTSIKASTTICSLMPITYIITILNVYNTLLKCNIVFCSVSSLLTICRYLNIVFRKFKFVFEKYSNTYTYFEKLWFFFYLNVYYKHKIKILFVKTRYQHFVCFFFYGRVLNSNHRKSVVSSAQFSLFCEIKLNIHYVRYLSPMVNAGTYSVLIVLKLLYSIIV